MTTVPHTQQQTSPLTGDLILRGPSDASSNAATTPRLVYGTAWKKDRTADLVYQALKSGFRGIDTAAQPRHYQEALVGDGIRRAIRDGLVTRADLYLQTKFTSIGGQDPDNLPYDPSASLEDQVRASIASSLRNLTTSDTRLAAPSGSESVSTDGTAAAAAAAAAGKPGQVEEIDDDETYLDCLVLHSPLDDPADTLTVWRALSAFVPHRVRHLGIANTDAATLDLLLRASSSSSSSSPSAPIPMARPSVVQNRFYPGTRWDVPLRARCRAEAIVFQTFWTLTGNPRLVRSAVVAELAARVSACTTSGGGGGGGKDDGADEEEQISPEVAYYALVLGLGGTSILDGTTSAAHMRADLQGVERVGRWAAEEDGAWQDALGKFRRLIGEV